jgi:hypothetical protein
VPSAREPPCLPGDIFITPVFSGFLLGRVIPQIGIGPWWTLIKVVAEFDDAVEQARALARAEGVRAWWQERVNEYDALLERTPTTR